MFGGGALIEAFTSKLSEGGTIGALDSKKLFPKLKDPVGGGGGCGGLGPPSKKSSIVSKVGGSPPGPPKRFELLLLLKLLLLLLLIFLLMYEDFRLSLSSLFWISNSLPG